MTGEGTGVDAVTLSGTVSGVAGSTVSLSSGSGWLGTTGSTDSWAGTAAAGGGVATELKG